MFSFKCIVLIATVFTIGAESSGVPVAAPLVAPAHVGYAQAIPQNIPPFASQVNVVTKALSPLVAAPAIAAPYAAPLAAPYGAPFAAPLAAPYAAPFTAPLAAAPYIAAPSPVVPAPYAAAPYALPGVPSPYAAPYPYGAPLIRAFNGLAPAFVR